MTALSSNVPASHPSVVIVDDEVDHALIVRLVLHQIVPDATVAIMTDPRALAQRLIEAPLGSVVLLDRHLDGCDGIELLPLLAAERGDLRVVLLSAALTEPDRLRALAGGAYDAVEKPSSVVEWRSFVTALLDTTAAPAARSQVA